jgi:cobalamin biosynthesis protein CobT
MSNKMWGNNDADAIMFSYDRLLKQQTKRKVMIVLSDGSPADGMAGTDPYYALRYVVGNIEQEKKCDIIGIGILDDSVKEFYKKHVIVRSVNALEQELLTIISNNIAGVN